MGEMWVLRRGETATLSWQGSDDWAMTDMWDRVDELVDRAGDIADLREHRLELLAARRWRQLGRPVPDELVAQERFAAVIAMTAPVLLGKVRAALDGPIVLLKGPEVAAGYPNPALRPYKDLDLLVPNARAAQEALKSAGFEEVGDPAVYVGIHHLRPLWLRPLPLYVELHSTPKWIESLAPPPTSELLAVAVPSRVGVEGISTLRPDHHALVLAAHSWAHEPLRRLLELIDVASMIRGLDPAQLRALAETWRMARVWNTTLSASESLLENSAAAADPMPLRLWARNLPAVRRRTVFESHLERWLATFWALPLRPAFRATGVSARRAFGPAEGETWSEKLARMRLAFRNASAPRSQHDRELRERHRD
jgi:hypothetical protein